MKLEATNNMDNQHVDLFLLINQHRKACGRPEFESLTEAQIHEHMDLIDKHAPYGNDPWAHQDLN